MSEFVGVDLHQRYCLIVRLDAEGRLLERRRVSTEAATLRTYFERLDSTAQIVVEATGNWMYFADLLHDRHLVLAHPWKTRAIAAARIKTDTLDAMTLAHLLRANLIPQAYLAPPHVRERRELVRYRARLSRDRAKVKTRIRSLLAKSGMHLPDSNVLGRNARRTLATLQLPPAAALTLAGYLRLADALTAELHTASAHIAAAVANDAQAQLLMTLPGLGAFGASLVSAAIGTIDRFASGKHLVSYFGLAPGVHSSGDRTRYQALTKQGDSDVRWLLIEAVTHAARHEPFAHVYQRVKARHGAAIARVHVARVLVHVIYRLLKERRPFVPVAQWPGRPQGDMMH